MVAAEFLLGRRGRFRDATKGGAHAPQFSCRQSSKSGESWEFWLSGPEPVTQDALSASQESCEGARFASGTWMFSWRCCGHIERRITPCLCMQQSAAASSGLQSIHKKQQQEASALFADISREIEDRTKHMNRLRVGSPRASVSLRLGRV